MITRTNIFYLVAGVILSLVLSNSFNWNGGGYEVERVDTLSVTNYIDSVRIKDSVVFIEKEAIRERDATRADIEIIPEEERESIGIENIERLGVRTYRGQKERNGITYWYELETVGWLKDIQVGSTFYQIKEREVTTIQKTVRKPFRGLYVNTTFHTDSGLGVGAAYQWKKTSLGYNYFIDGAQQITVGYKLF